MDAKWGIMMCELKGRMDKGGYHHVEIKDVAATGQFGVQIKRVDG